MNPGNLQRQLKLLQRLLPSLQVCPKALEEHEIDIVTAL